MRFWRVIGCSHITLAKKERKKERKIDDLSSDFISGFLAEREGEMLNTAEAVLRHFLPGKECCTFDPSRASRSNSRHPFPLPPALRWSSHPSHVEGPQPGTSILSPGFVFCLKNPAELGIGNPNIPGQRLINPRAACFLSSHIVLPGDPILTLNCTDTVHSVASS